MFYSNRDDQEDIYVIDIAFSDGLACSLLTC